MQANRAMRALLQRYHVDPACVPPLNLYPVWKKVDDTGRPYWGCGKDSSYLPRENLSWMEWDMNETYLSTNKPGKIREVLILTVSSVKAWKDTLEKRYPETPFCLFFNYDDGSFQEPDPGKEPYRCTFARFWAIREGETVLDFSDFEDRNEPAMMDVCNTRGRHT